MISKSFPYDVFLSHSAKDKAVVRPLAERLRKDGVKVWFDEWEIKPGDRIPAKIEEGLEHSRVLVLCMSAQAFGSDWAQLESTAPDMVWCENVRFSYFTPPVWRSGGATGSPENMCRFD